jgi:cell wall-associated NlpC family hydrolase
MGVLLLSMVFGSMSVFAASNLPLVYGDRGPLVATVERDLTQLGYYHGAIDGIFGPEVYAGVETFQQAHGLKTTGKIGSKVLSELIQATQPKTNASASLAAPPPPAGYLYLGSKGAEVLTLQKDLATLGYYTGNATGYYGEVTLKAVVAYQEAQGLPDHGYVGALTLAALSKSLAAQGQENSLVSRGGISTTATAIIGLALKYVGASYVYGGASPATGFDCSGFVQWVYGQFGIQLPRTTFEQWNAGTHVAMSQLQPGDLVFFTTEGVFCNHVGIYLGGGQFISDTAPGQGVQVQNLNSAFFVGAFDGGVSVIPGT